MAIARNCFSGSSERFLPTRPLVCTFTTVLMTTVSTVDDAFATIRCMLPQQVHHMLHGPLFSSTYTSHAPSILPPFTSRRPLNDTQPPFRVQSKSQQVLMSMVDAAASKSGPTGGRGGTGGGGGGGGGAAGLRIMMTTRDASKLISSVRKVVKPLKVRRT